MTLPVDQRKEWIRSRRNKRKQARSARYRRQFFRYFLLLALLYGGYSGFARLPWGLSDVSRDIQVRGNHIASEDQVRGVLGNAMGAKVFQIDPKMLEKQVESLKAVRHAFVRRYALPHPTVVVDVLEEFPWATYSPNPETPPTAVIAESGRMIPINEFPTVAQPKLLIYGPGNMKITRSEVAQWAQWVGFIAEQTGEEVQFVDMRKPQDVRVQDGSDIYLKLGTADTTLTRRLGRLSSVLTAIEPLKGRLEYVDLGLDNNIPIKVAKLVPGAKPPHAAAASGANAAGTAKIAEKVERPLSTDTAAHVQQAQAANPGVL